MSSPSSIGLTCAHAKQTELMSQLVGSSAAGPDFANVVSDLPRLTPSKSSANEGAKVTRDVSTFHEQFQARLLMHAYAQAPRQPHTGVQLPRPETLETKYNLC